MAKQGTGRLLWVSNHAGLLNDISPLMEWNYTNQGTNNNPLTYRMVNDGEFVSMYVNPNPLGLNPNYSNTLYLIDKTPVIYSNRLVPMVGVGTLNYNGFSVCVVTGRFAHRRSETTAREEVGTKLASGVIDSTRFLVTSW